MYGIDMRSVTKKGRSWKHVAVMASAWSRDGIRCCDGLVDSGETPQHVQCQGKSNERERETPRC